MLLQLLIVAALALVHLFAGRLRFLGGLPRSRWLSAAGGTSVAYVFIHVFPELAAAQQSIGRSLGAGTRFEHHAYLMALLGLTVFYGLERSVKSRQHSRGERPGSDEGETTTGAAVFWLHIGSFALYNALVGYLIVHREEQTLRGLLFFGVAMTLHFLVNDYGLRQDHKDTYKRVGRWLLALAIGAGWAVGRATAVGEAATGLLFAFLAGGVVLNVLKEELPEERKSRFGAFAGGVAAYAALLLLV